MPGLSCSVCTVPALGRYSGSEDPCVSSGLSTLMSEIPYHEPPGSKNMDNPDIPPQHWKRAFQPQISLKGSPEPALWKCSVKAWPDMWMALISHLKLSFVGFFPKVKVWSAQDSPYLTAFISDFTGSCIWTMPKCLLSSRNNSFILSQMTWQWAQRQCYISCLYIDVSFGDMFLLTCKKQKPSASPPWEPAG